MKKTFKTLGYVCLVAIAFLFLTGLKVKADEFSDLETILSSELKTYKGSFLEQKKQYYNLLKTGTGFLSNLNDYLKAAYEAGVDRSDQARLDVIISGYDTCKQTAIERFDSFTKRKFFITQSAPKKSAGNISSLFANLPSGNSICTEYYYSGNASRVDNSRNGICFAAQSEFNLIQGMSKDELNKAGIEQPEYCYNSYAWCCNFVSTMAERASLSSAIPRNSNVGGLEEGIIKAGGKSHSMKEINNGSYSAKPGDIIIFGNSTEKRHAGIIINSYYDESLKEVVFITIEGNTTQVKDKNTIAVCETKTRYNSQWSIRAILEPNY